MALTHSPQVVTNGLVFYYDMYNTKKSFIGAPTTNLVPNMGLTPIGLTFAYIGIEDGWRKYSISGTWASGTYPYAAYVDAYTFTGGVYYSTSCYVKTNVIDKFETKFAGMNYVNQPMNDVGTSFSILQPDGSYYVGRINFAYTGTTAQNGYFVLKPLGDGTVFNSYSDFIYIKNGQVEQKAFPTPFTSGTRSNTQSLLDLMGTYTITSSNLVYASDNTFSLNGTSSNISTNFPALTIPQSTIEAIVYDTKNNGAYRSIVQINAADDALYIYPSNNLGFWPSGTSSLAVSPNAWHYVAMTYNGTSITYYVDGNSQTLTGPFTDPTDYQFLKIGGNAVGDGESFGGKIALVRLYVRALSSAEIKQNFEALRGRFGI